ncbi:uncharacterized protein LOC110845767 isoform X2 [Folsomia candida]|nr:uncharacterized protein LOC110845767 isoform X2 [Folsomia candida]
MPPPKHISGFSLAHRLYEQYESGEHVDAAFSVGDRKLFLHKCMLCAASEEFRNIFRHQENLGSLDPNTISLPEETSLEAVKEFIVVIYFCEIDTTLEINLLLEVLSLCDKFLRDEFLDQCLIHVVENITKDNCAEICETHFVMPRCQVLFDVAWEYLK